MILTHGFMADLFQAVFNAKVRSSVEVLMATHPKTDGQSERTNSLHPSDSQHGRQPQTVNGRICYLRVSSHATTTTAYRNQRKNQRTDKNFEFHPKTPADLLCHGCSQTSYSGWKDKLPVVGRKTGSTTDGQ